MRSSDLLRITDPARQREVLETLAHPEEIRGILERIVASDELAAAIGAASFGHPLGFDKYVLHSRYPAGQLRLHVWWPGEERAEEHIHDHRFSLSSAVVAGSLTAHVYRPVPPPSTAAGPLRMYRDASVKGAGQWHLEELGELAVETALSMTMTPGGSYSMSPDTLHRVDAGERLTVTLFLETAIVRDHSTVLAAGAPPSAPVRRDAFGAEALRERLGTLATRLV